MAMYDEIHLKRLILARKTLDGKHHREITVWVKAEMVDVLLDTQDILPPQIWRFFKDEKQSKGW